MRPRLLSCCCLATVACVAARSAIFAKPRTSTSKNVATAASHNGSNNGDNEASPPHRPPEEGWVRFLSSTMMIPLPQSTSARISRTDLVMPPSPLMPTESSILWFPRGGGGGGRGSNGSGGEGSVSQDRAGVSGDDHAHSGGEPLSIEDYVAAVLELDRQRNAVRSSQDEGGADGAQGPEHPDSLDQSSDPAHSPPTTTPPSSPAARGDDDSHVGDTAEEGTAAAAVGVKTSAHGKKGNAVGDPDGDGSDDNESESESDWEEFDHEMEGIMSGSHEKNDSIMMDPTTQVQMELELVEEEEVDEEAAVVGDDDHWLSKPAIPDSTRSGGGGVGLLSHRLGRRRNDKTKDPRQKQVAGSGPQLGQPRLYLEAWHPFVYYPPSRSALDYLKDRSRLVDGASKTRLDRRTLYACLLLEWLHASSSYRKFLDAQTSQALQAALSMATQPQWRRSFPRHNGMRLYDSDDPHRGCTLAMQESIALALAHSLGAGMVILDDPTLFCIRQKLLSLGFSEEEVRPAALIQSLLTMARAGQLQQGGGLISSCMRRDLALGLDDPFDERAASSCHEMNEWESKWNVDKASPNEPAKENPLPLVIFLRVESSTGLLKSKSVIELLRQECNSSDGTNLIVLGKGINARTTSIPQDVAQDGHESPGDISRMQGSQQFGFSPNNQNASGQNDPEGSRRFNIFLARTVDAEGTAGIMGAIAHPQAGNLFPHMMAMQARDRMQPNNAPAKADLERWAQQFQHHMQSPGVSSMAPPQFFNATLSSIDSDNPAFSNPPSPEVIQEALQQAMGELLDRLAQVNEDTDGPPGIAPDLQRAFAQVLRNENLRRGIAENLARAAPALSDPKCQGVMLSVYVPPPPQHVNRGKLPGPASPSSNKSPSNMGGWFQKILNNQDIANAEEDSNSKQKRVRTMAAAAAVLAANKAQESADSDQGESKADRNLVRLETLCRPVIVKTPADPVRAKSWEAWISRERGAVIFRQNRRVLNDQLESHSLTLQEHVGTRGAGSALRQMLSVRDISDEMEDVIKLAVELEAAKSQRQHESPSEMHEKEADLAVDITLSQLFLRDDGVIEDHTLDSETKESDRREAGGDVKYIHPSSLESALTMVCRISPSPSGGLSISGSNAAHRSREEIMSLAQDKHERALVSQVVSPQDIGVTYDMIGGLSEVKELLRQSITYPLKFPHLYSEGIAREAVKGVLLFGPPGTGKTMLAKAVATEGGASFLSVDASSIENKWLGESEKNAKAVFTLARRLAPCVIFIDEVDSLLSSREGTSDDSAHGTLTSVKTTLMGEWDGLNSGTNGVGEAGSDRVVVIGSTNRPFDLDEAVLRRFPRRILVDLPDLETRTEILEVTLAENRLDSGVNLTQIAERLEGYTGSDIKEVCREAVVQISHEQARLLDQGLSDTRADITQGSLQRLRPVTAGDFERALRKLKRSVSETGREIARVWEWNDEYGEIKKEQRNHLPHLASMYL